MKSGQNQTACPLHFTVLFEDLGISEGICVFKDTQRSEMVDVLLHSLTNWKAD